MAALLSDATQRSPSVRPAREEDAGAVVPLLYASAGGMYDRYAGGSRRALRLLERAYTARGTNASSEVIAVAEIDGRVAAAMAAFTTDEIAARASAFLRLTLRSVPPWRVPAALRLYWAGMRAAPSPPRSALYVDALATTSEHRRRGAAGALLTEAERVAKELDMPAVALDTALDNKPARALYLGRGYEEVAYRPPGRRLPGFVALVKPLA
ncbi:MAG: GNAT family N-acetyltransferase [Thermoleophilaceae bacterium]